MGITLVNRNGTEKSKMKNEQSFLVYTGLYKTSRLFLLRSIKLLVFGEVLAKPFPH